MSRLMLLGAAVAVLGLAACERPVQRTEVDADATPEKSGLRTIDKLDCPEKQGDLTLASAAADGKSCAYTMDGAEVDLRLVALTNNDAKAVLDPIEAELKGVIPPPQKAAGATASIDAKEDNAGKGGERAEIKFPGLHIRADEDGADVRIGGIKVDADNDGAKVQVGNETTVNATDEGAEIRTLKSGDELRSTYILASDKGSNGYHVVGYEARGPKAGPIVVAVVKAKRDDRKQDDLFDDMKDLVERNVGE